MKTLLAYWYHFAIMFEALFILTTIDTGTRIGRFLVQELLGRVSPQLGETGWLPGALLSTALIVGGWSYFILTGCISTIWPMFGVANQLLACAALCVATTIILREAPKKRYALVTLLPLAFVSTTTITAGDPGHPHPLPAHDGARPRRRPWAASTWWSRRRCSPAWRW